MAEKCKNNNNDVKKNKKRQENESTFVSPKPSVTSLTQTEMLFQQQDDNLYKNIPSTSKNIIQSQQFIKIKKTDDNNSLNLYRKYATTSPTTSKAVPSSVLSSNGKKYHGMKEGEKNILETALKSKSYSENKFIPSDKESGYNIVGMKRKFAMSFDQEKLERKSQDKGPVDIIQTRRSIKRENVECKLTEKKVKDAGDSAVEGNGDGNKRTKMNSERDEMFEIFQPWALKTYGDQAKTKTITLKKKARILKALEGKEHSKPDSSKFRFWVKSKGFTTKKPEKFIDIKEISSKNKDGKEKDDIDLFVASTSKDFGERYYRKVAVVEEFFNIIFEIHVNLGGRSGRHAGQKRTYRIITETYAFLPREAVTKFLSNCPECKKNLRPFSPSPKLDEHLTESSSEQEIINYSLQSGSEKTLLKRKFQVVEEASVSEYAKQMKVSDINVSRQARRSFDDSYLRIRKDFKEMPKTFQSDVAKGPLEKSIQRQTLTTHGQPMPSHSQSQITLDPNIFQYQYRNVLPKSRFSTGNISSIDLTLTDPQIVQQYPYLAEMSLPTQKSRQSESIAAQTKKDFQFSSEQTITKDFQASYQPLPHVPTCYSDFSQPIPRFPNLNIENLRNHENFIKYYQFLSKFYNPQTSSQSIPTPWISNPLYSNISEMNPFLIPLQMAKDTYKSKLENPITNPESSTTSASSTPAPSPPTTSSSLDLKIVKTEQQSQKININIENTLNLSSDSSIDLSISPPHSSKDSHKLDVSINVSNESNELKISCKSTPPSKDIYKPESIEISPITPVTTEQSSFTSSSPTATSSTTATKPISLNSDRQTIQTCAINLSKKFLNETETKCDQLDYNIIKSEKPETINLDDDDNDDEVRNKKTNGQQRQQQPIQIQDTELLRMNPITSTYLALTRSMGMSDEDALKIDDMETVSTPAPESLPETNSEDPYAGFMKDADKLKLMLLAWNYQNTNAIRNGNNSSGTGGGNNSGIPPPDLGVVSDLWAQYQNALAMNAKQPSVSPPVTRTEPSTSPIENQDETNSSGQKEDEDGSEDDSDDKLDHNTHDPERLKAFNMFVRLFVDENLDRMIPISKQPKEKIQAIMDSCSRQFPEFSERSRKRIRTYLKSCRRNKKAREGWENTTRPTPAHLTSVQAEQILALACENESMNAKRMRVGLDPISQSLPLNGNLSANPSIDTIAPSTGASTTFPGFRTNDTDITVVPATTVTPITSVNSSRNSPLSLNSNALDVKNLTNVLTNGMANSLNNNINNNTNNINTTTNTNNSSITNGNSPLYRPADFAAPNSNQSNYISVTKTQTYPTFFPTSSPLSNSTPTDLSMKNNSTQQLSQTLSNSQPTASISPNRPPPIFGHKLSTNEITAARQVISAYRESAAFLLRTADQVEQLLIQQQ